MAHVREQWHLYDPDVTEVARWTDEYVQVTSSVLDALSEPLQWLLFHTLPVQVVLTAGLTEAEADERFKEALAGTVGGEARGVAALPPREKEKS